MVGGSQPVGRAQQHGDGAAGTRHKHCCCALPPPPAPGGTTHLNGCIGGLVHGGHARAVVLACSNGAKGGEGGGGKRLRESNQPAALLRQSVSVVGVLQCASAKCWAWGACKGVSVSALERAGRRRCSPGRLHAATHAGRPQQLPQPQRCAHAVPPTAVALDVCLQGHGAHAGLEVEQALQAGHDGMLL